MKKHAAMFAMACAMVCVMALLTSCSSVQKKITLLPQYQMLQPASPLQVPYPIILVHGLGQKSDVWNGRATQYFSGELGLRFGGVIRTAGGSSTSATSKSSSAVNPSSSVVNSSGSVVGDFYVVQFSNSTDSINAWRDELDVCVNYVRSVTKADKVILIGYSMGGLASRAYLVKRLTDHHVKRLITVGTPHLGSAFAKAYNWKTGLQKCLYSNNIVLTPFCKAALTSLVATERDVAYDSPALRDLRRPKDGGTFLRSLNVRSHPLNLEYVSVVGQLNMFEQATQLSEGAFQELIRKVISVIGSDFGEVFRAGDGVVSAASQDITNIEFFKLNKANQRAARTVEVPSLHVEHLQQSVEVQRIALDDKPEFKGARIVMLLEIPTLVVEFTDYIPKLCTLNVVVKQGDKTVSAFKTSGANAELLLSPSGVVAQHRITAIDLNLAQEIGNANIDQEPFTFHITITNSFGYTVASYVTW
ncbi:MAG: alpha/beta fold hydrolase [Ignavibacteria bacterium]|nr:alpha/beta fold hydrolase [Ignavibacteria bacterium]